VDEFFLAIDLGGTNTKVGIVEKTRGLIDSKTVSTIVKDGPERAAKLWADAARPWLEKHKVLACGIGSPGPLERGTGVLHESPNLPGWENFSFTEFIRKLTGLPTFLDKDATVAALGEWCFGEGRGLTDFIVVTLGTGIGTGVITGGHVLRGSKGYAPEIGHMVIDDNGPLCNCGRHGCIEAFTGATAAALRYNESRGYSSSLVNIAEIFSRAQKGELAAGKIMSQWSKSMAVALGNMINIFNPQKIILTGGVSKNWTIVAEEIQKILLHEAFEPSLKCTEIVLSKLGNDGALLGAAHLAQTQL